MVKYAQLNRLDRRRIYLLKQKGFDKQAIAERVLGEFLIIDTSEHLFIQLTILK